MLYTDGVIDARSPDGQAVRTARIIDSVTGAAANRPRACVDRIVGRINHFRGNRELPDDLTLVCIQTQGQLSSRGAETVTV